MVALDVPTPERAVELAAQLAPAVGALKIGKELFTAAGPDIVRRLRATGAPVFRDLKFHDIPNAVARAVEAAVRLDVQMLTVHASGGTAMLVAAEQAAQAEAGRLGRMLPLVLGVAVLTSLDDATLAEAGINVGAETAGGLAWLFVIGHHLNQMPAGVGRVSGHGDADVANGSWDEFAIVAFGG
ncbi:MAG: orotidine-5'-phosphate decarboxylase [Verrucomicrobiota bacterium]|jgi:orotidine-5'-phosphate decarboxylase